MSYCDEDFMIQLQGPHLDKAEEVTDPILLNMAAAQLKTGEYALAAHNSTQVTDMIRLRSNCTSVIVSAVWYARYLSFLSVCTVPQLRKHILVLFSRVLLAG